MEATALRVHAVRLTPGTDLKAELARLTQKLDLRAGFILSGIGSLYRARLRMPGGAGEADAFADFEEPMEIVSLAGTLGPDGLHAHLVLSRRDGSCVGGHLVAGCIVHTTVELVIGEAEGLVFRRPVDPATGYGELSVEQRDGG